jgi:hypothetical protein
MPRGTDLDLSSGLKTCPKCLVEKPLSEYHRSKATVGGYQVYCKVCGAARHSEWRLKNLAKCAADQKKYRQNNPEQFADYSRKNLYGLKPGEYDTMLASQNGRCAICLTNTPGGKGPFHVDHCHEGGHIRGLLCHCCNLGIGYLKHSKTVLEAAIVYLAERGAEGRK